MTLSERQAPPVTRDDFDAVWYLRINPDVAEAGMDPWEHYTLYGHAEGRAGRPLRALELDHVIWRGYGREAEAELRLLLRGSCIRERAAAGWVLARWAATHGRWRTAHAAIRHYVKAPDEARALTHSGPWLLAIQAAARAGLPEAARALMNDARRGLGLVRPLSQRLTGWLGKRAFRSPVERDLVLARLEMAVARGRPEHVLSRLLGALHAGTEVAGLRLYPGTAEPFDRIEGRHPSQPVTEGPLISVIVPAYNCSGTIETCLRGLSDQSWRNLDIIVVDDASTDATAEVVTAASHRDPRIRLLQQPRNGGAYLARNAGLAVARGVFVTVHDADDWSHPQKLELQARALQDNPEAFASASHLVRLDNRLRMGRWRMEESWIQRNVSSLMFRRTQMTATLGGWDRVRASADTEYYHRIRRAFGQDAIIEVLPGVPLSFARSHPGGLTASAACHLSTQFIGARRSYIDAADDWHDRRLAALPPDAAPACRAAALRLPLVDGCRPFWAPAAIGPADPAPPDDAYAALAGSDRLDRAWYWRRYPDVLAADIDPVAHYLRQGAAEGRDPGPLFPALMWQKTLGAAQPDVPLPAFAGLDLSGTSMYPPPLPGALADLRAPVALVFAHAAEREIFGAERSLLLTLERIAEGYDGRPMAPVVILPSAVNDEYIAALRARAAWVWVLPQVWYHRFRTPPAPTVAAIRALIRRHHACAVHVNTMVLDAPLVAARLEGCTSVVHVRELPPQDPALCRILGSSAPALRRHLLANADRLTANGPPVEAWLNCGDRVSSWPNLTEPALFDLPFAAGAGIRVALISSNIAKKGIGDFCDVARQVAALEEAGGIPLPQRCRFVLIGPWSPDLAALGPLPGNVAHTGYVSEPVAALEQCDLVLVLSHFAESFGRTALEALSAGRPVICYDRGMPPRLVEDGLSGRVVPAGDTAAVATAILGLAGDRDALERTSLAARRRGHALSGNRGGEAAGTAIANRSPGDPAP